MDVGLLFVAVLKNSVWKQFDDYEGVAKTVWVQWDYVSGMQNLGMLMKIRLLNTV